MNSVKVIGAGLAGCEAAWQLASRDIDVELYEMKPEKKTPAHSSDALAELVCSNSLRGSSLETAPGLLKEELRRCGSLIMFAADALGRSGKIFSRNHRYDQKRSAHHLYIEGSYRPA